ncbi:Hsp70 family protein [Paractinoplanes lichenicola]|uniref:Uncharacterized protein n=1 Tax=Paractinoplanes lichenicola TaxID=2802976 RepID=A0ABS1VDF6_9ACTN|nr:hypothetical protein [Actinoplanes lichenicola]MBL7252716.1 hypothetical protein [Actinoplanes lichenicola]
MESTWPVVAAIDFGTHGTGYAWCEVTEANRDTSQRRLVLRERWPGSGMRYPKNLTALLLDAEGEVTEYGHLARQRWLDLSQDRAHDQYTYVSGFKMALKPDSYQGMSPPGIGARTIDSPRDAYPLVVAYLRYMYGIAMDEIGRSGYLDDQVRWCITIPAIWDEQEKQLMRDAAEEAGLPKDPDRLLLAIEPEVAALHCLIHLTRVLGTQNDVDITADNQRFTVVDCGGGTVDITSYRVNRSGADNRPRLAQIARAAGGKLGSEYINQAFVEEVLGERFGGPEVMARIQQECPHALAAMVDAWESFKVTAEAEIGPDGEPVFQRPVFLPIPGEINELLSEEVKERLAGLPGGAHRLAVQPDECRRLFDSVVISIIELVEEQIQEVREKDGPAGGSERLLLVGGLSAASYLQLRLQNHFGANATLMVPTDPAGAVLLGAAHYGYDPSMIRSRLARYTYGCDSAMAFRPNVDPQTKRWLDHNGKAWCTGRYQIFIRNGDSAELDDMVNHSFSPLDPEQTSLSFTFYRTVPRDPVYVDETAAESIGNLTVQLGDAMSLPLEQRSVRVMFRFGNTEIEVEAVNEHTGEQMTCTLRFDTAY